MSASRTSAPAHGVDAVVVAAWEEALRAYASGLDEHRTTLLGVEADSAAVLPVEPPPAFVPPADLQPMPESLLPWARQLLEQTSGLVQLAAELAERSERSLALNGRNHRHRPILADASVSTWDALL